MGEIFRKLMTRLPQETPSHALATRIVARIEAFETGRIRLRMGAFFAFALFSGGVFIEAFTITSSALVQSGFWQYLSLIVTDTNSLFPIWKELAISLLTSLPISVLMLALVSLGGLLWSAASFIKNSHTGMPFARA